LPLQELSEFFTNLIHVAHAEGSQKRGQRPRAGPALASAKNEAMLRGTALSVRTATPP
jgi:hypothetical protein